MEAVFGIIIVVIIVAVIVLSIREQWVKFTRSMHNVKRSIVEVRDIDDIVDEEDAMRAVNGMMGQYIKKKGGFFKTLIWIVIIVIVGYFILSNF